MDRAVGVSSVIAPRPMRADARRNYERILAVAKQAFFEHGAAASLDDIARRAEVGPGTLYRHFPNRSALLDAVYREHAQAVSDQAEGLTASLPPVQALAAWLRCLALSISDNQGLKEATAAENLDLSACRDLYRTAGGALLAAAQETGEVRTDLDIGDVFKFVHATTMGTEKAEDRVAQIDRLLPVVLDALRVRG